MVGGHMNSSYSPLAVTSMSEKADICLVLVWVFLVMYHLLKGLHQYLTRKEEFSVIIIGLDGAGKTVRQVAIFRNALTDAGIDFT